MPSKKTTLLTSVALLVGIGITIFVSHFFFGPDSYIEELAEDYIEERVGIKFDLTPSSQEE